MVDLSIVICTFNRGERLSKSLEALQDMKTSGSWEAIIVDNASTDETAKVILAFADSDPRFRYVFEPQQGLGAARDTAWRHASGAIVSFTDDDCYVAEDFADKVLEAFQQRPDAGFLGGRILLHDPDDAPVTIKTIEAPFDIPPAKFVPAGIFHGANMSFRRSVLETIGGFDRDLGAGTQFRAGEDIDVVASAVWHGIAGGYDPGPTVSHHHGRKVDEIPKLRAGYDVGRAAYFAKYVSNPSSRWAYVIAFLRQHIEPDFVEDQKRSWRYLRYGSRYLRNKGKLLGSIMFAGLALVRMFVAFLQRIRWWFRRKA